MAKAVSPPWGIGQHADTLRGVSCSEALDHGRCCKGILIDELYFIDKNFGYPYEQRFSWRFKKKMVQYSYTAR
ncbi:hypothetical protein EGYY_18360 [Eggerthella sp. YY7918]|nr:hypothetical protein EGYY_18360 [Eggerthella sp. YY7918]